MDTVLTHTTAFLGVAILVAIIARRVHLPYTVGLVVAGIGLAVAGLETGAMLTHDFIFEVILPPLLFGRLDFCSLMTILGRVDVRSDRVEINVRRCPPRRTA